MKFYMDIYEEYLTHFNREDKVKAQPGMIAESVMDYEIKKLTPITK